jgi:hypothetical protein
MGGLARLPGDGPLTQVAAAEGSDDSLNQIRRVRFLQEEMVEVRSRVESIDYALMRGESAIALQLIDGLEVRLARVRKNLRKLPSVRVEVIHSELL